jgi:hypothetical protein
MCVCLVQPLQSCFERFKSPTCNVPFYPPVSPLCPSSVVSHTKCIDVCGAARKKGVCSSCMSAAAAAAAALYSDKNSTATAADAAVQQ